MNKKRSYKINIAFIALLFFVCYAFCLTSHAEQKERDVYYVDTEGENFMISIVYDNNDVSFSLKDPEDNVISLGTANVSYIQDSGATLILVENAKQGQWKLIYDKGSNEAVEVAAYQYDSPFTVDSVTVGAASGDSLPVSFTVSQAQGREYNYEIRLGVDENMEQFRTLLTGTAKAGENVSINVSCADVNTYDQYYIQVVAYYDNDDMRYFDMETSAAFAYTNPNPDVPNIPDYNLVVDTETTQLTVNLADYVPSDVTNYCVRLTEDGVETLTKVFERSEDGDVVEVLYQPSSTVVECSLEIQYSNGRIGAPVKKTIYLAPQQDQFTISLPENGVLTSNIYTITYENATSQVVSYSIDDSNDKKDFTINGSGNYMLTLDDYTSEIYIAYTTPENITYMYHQYITIDDIPPELKIYEAVNGMHANKSTQIVTGKTEVGAILTVNGNEIAVNEDGSFSTELSLSDGENVFEFKATDESGNVTSYVVKITYGDVNDDDLSGYSSTSKGKKSLVDIIGKWFWLITLVFFVLLVAFEWIFVIAGRKKRPLLITLNRASVTLLVFSAIGFLFDFIYLMIRRSFEKSEKFVNLALVNIKRAYKYLKITKGVKVFMIIFLLLLIASIVMLVVCRMKLKKNPMIKQNYMQQKMHKKQGGPQGRPPQGRLNRGPQGRPPQGGPNGWPQGRPPQGGPNRGPQGRPPQGGPNGGPQGIPSMPPQQPMQQTGMTGQQPPVQ